MTEDEWFDTYKPTKNSHDPEASWNGTLIGTSDAEQAQIKSASPDRIWTLTETDGVMHLTNGFHTVNRLGYFVCSVPYSGPDIEIPIEQASN
jgi:hypothetical protein